MSQSREWWWGEAAESRNGVGSDLNNPALTDKTTAPRSCPGSQTLQEATTIFPRIKHSFSISSYEWTQVAELDYRVEGENSGKQAPEANGRPVSCAG